MATTSTPTTSSARQIRRDKALVMRELERIGLRGMPLDEAQTKSAAAVERRAPVWGYAIRQTTKAVQGWHGWETSGILTEGQRLHLERPVSERAALRMVRWAQAGWIERDTRGRPSYGNRVPELATLAARCGLSDWYQQMGWPWCAFGVHVAALAEGSRTARLGLGGAYNALWTVAILGAARRQEHGLKLVEASKWRLGTWLEFDFPGGEEVDHIGAALGPIGAGGYGYDARADWIVTVEGNTSPGTDGSQSNGGVVAIRQRPVSTIRAGLTYR